MSIRLRLTLWYGLAIAVTIALVALVVWLRFAADLRSTLQEALAVQVADTRAGLDSGDGGNPLSEDPARPGIFTAVLDPSGLVALASRNTPAGLGAVPVGSSTWRPPGARADVALFAAQARDGRTVVAGSSLASIDGDSDRLAGLLLVVGTLATVASLAGGWWLARRALAPVALLVDEADRIHASERSLGRRLRAPHTDDELGRLAATLNRMLERIERTILHQRAFVTSASHDLRTPVAALRAELELALRSDGTEDELRAAIRAALGDVERLGELADDLLDLAAAEEGGRASMLEIVDLRTLVSSVTERAAGADGKHVDIELEVEDASVTTDRIRVEQALANLVSNAVQHSPEGGPVTIRARCVTEMTGDGATRQSLDVDVLDRGPGVPGEAVGTLFVPFARPRDDRAGGGLGLATAETAVRALGGRIGYRDRPGGGAWFWFRVPAPSDT